MTAPQVSAEQARHDLESANAFVRANLAQCCRELVELATVGVLPDGAVRQAAKLYASLSMDKGLTIAQRQVERFATEAIAQHPAPPSGSVGEDGGCRAIYVPWHPQWGYSFTQAVTEQHALSDVDGWRWHTFERAALTAAAVAAPAGGGGVVDGWRRLSEGEILADADEVGYDGVWTLIPSHWVGEPFEGRRIVRRRIALAGVSPSAAHEEGTRATLQWIMRRAESAKEPCGMDPESPAAIRNGVFADISQAAATALGIVRGPSYATPEAAQEGGKAHIGVVNALGEFITAICDELEVTTENGPLEALAAIRKLRDGRDWTWLHVASNREPATIPQDDRPAREGEIRRLRDALQSIVDDAKFCHIHGIEDRGPEYAKTAAAALASTAEPGRER